MSNLEVQPEEVACGAAGGPEGPEWELLEGREVVLGGTRAMGVTALADASEGAMTVTRTLPNKHRRMVGAWCFVDHFGPSHGDGMRVPPHPHTGLQTVTWLLEGAIQHRDSVGSVQLIAPGQLNLMTSGRAIAHSEVAPAPGRSHGVQLWVALPAASRAVEPHFEHHPTLPVRVIGAATVTVLLGALGDVRSPARTYTPLVGAQIALASGSATLPLDPSFEHAALLLNGSAEVDGRELPPGPLLYLGRGRTELEVAGTGEVLLLGGVPFDEEIIMWWNFIGRSHEEIVADRTDWMAGRRFGPVEGYDGDPLPAPPLPTTRLKARGRLR